MFADKNTQNRASRIRVKLKKNLPVKDEEREWLKDYETRHAAEKEPATDGSAAPVQPVPSSPSSPTESSTVKSGAPSTPQDVPPLVLPQTASAAKRGESLPLAFLADAVVGGMIRANAYIRDSGEWVIFPDELVVGLFEPALIRVLEKHMPKSVKEDESLDEKIVLGAVAGTGGQVYRSYKKRKASGAKPEGPRRGQTSPTTVAASQPATSSVPRANADDPSHDAGGPFPSNPSVEPTDVKPVEVPDDIPADSGSAEDYDA